MDVLLRHNNKRHKLRVDADATLESFMRHVNALTNISPSRQLLKAGYPPQPLGGMHRYGGGEGGGKPKSALLRELGIQSNELIIVEEVPQDSDDNSDLVSESESAAMVVRGEGNTEKTAGTTLNGETAEDMVIAETSSSSSPSSSSSSSCPSSSSSSCSSSPNRRGTMHHHHPSSHMTTATQQHAYCREEPTTASDSTCTAGPSSASPPPLRNCAEIEDEEDAYTWEEDGVPYDEDGVVVDDVDEEEEEEEEAVGMPVRVLREGQEGTGTMRAAPEARRCMRQGGGGLNTRPARAVAASSATHNGLVRERREGGTVSSENGYYVEKNGLSKTKKEYLQPCSNSVRSVPPQGVGGATALQGAAEPSPPWGGGGGCGGGGGDGTRLLLRGGGGGTGFGNGGSNSKKLFTSSQRPADPSIVGEALRYVVPSDNSCLFTCLCILAAPHATPQQLRALVGSVIDADPENFTDAVLDRPRQEYIEWILSPTSWGGYVELAILAEQLQHEVVCVDVETKRKDFYGDPRFGRRIYLLYDGVHYDAIVARRKSFGADRGGAGGGGRGRGGRQRRCIGLGSSASSSSVNNDRGDGDDDNNGSDYDNQCTRGEEFLRVFFPTDGEMEAKAAAVAANLHHMKQFTNLQRMAMQCLVCGVGIRDQEHAREHAREFGHTNFGETRR